MGVCRISHSLGSQFLGRLEREGLTPELANRVVEDSDGGLARAMIAALSPKPQEPDFFTPILDADVPTGHQAILAKYRQLTTEHGVPVTTAVCYRVKAGFTLKSHAPKAGHCHENFQYLQGWNFPDEPTADSYVFWVPRIVNGSTGKTKDDQVKLLADLRTRLELPAHHLAAFGRVGLVAGLILAYHKATQEKVSLNGNCCYIKQMEQVRMNSSS